MLLTREDRGKQGEELELHYGYRICGETDFEAQDGEVLRVLKLSTEEIVYIRPGYNIKHKMFHLTTSPRYATGLYRDIAAWV